MKDYRQRDYSIKLEEQNLCVNPEGGGRVSYLKLQFEEDEEEKEEEEEEDDDDDDEDDEDEEEDEEEKEEEKRI